MVLHYDPLLPKILPVESVDHEFGDHPQDSQEDQKVSLLP